MSTRPTLQRFTHGDIPKWVNTAVELLIKKEVFNDYILRPSPNIDFKHSFADDAIFNSLNGLCPLTPIPIEIRAIKSERIIEGINIETESPYLIQRRLRFNNEIQVLATASDETTQTARIVFSQPIYRDGVCIGRGIPAQITTGKGNLRSAVTVNGFPTETCVKDFAGVVEGRPSEASRNKYVPVVSEEEWKAWFVRCKALFDNLKSIESFSWARWAIRLNDTPGNVPLFHDFKGNVIRFKDMAVLEVFGSIYVVDRFRSEGEIFEAHYARHISASQLNLDIGSSKFLSWLKMALGALLGVGVRVRETQIFPPLNLASTNQAQGRAPTVFEVFADTNAENRERILQEHNRKYPVHNPKEYSYEKDGGERKMKQKQLGEKAIEISLER